MQGNHKARKAASHLENQGTGMCLNNSAVERKGSDGRIDQVGAGLAKTKKRQRITKKTPA